MSAAQIRPGFTLLEMLAACVLLGLLVTLLLSLFNQGEIAWSASPRRRRRGVRSGHLPVPHEKERKPSS